MSYFQERIAELIKENIQNPEEAASEIVQMLVAEGLLGADDDDDNLENDCSHCGGSAHQENPNFPLYGDEYESCSACNGTGERKHQTIF